MVVEKELSRKAQTIAEVKKITDWRWAIDEVVRSGLSAFVNMAMRGKCYKDRRYKDDSLN